MKKKLLCLMMTMVMGFAAIAPTTANAAIKTIKGDVNGNGIVDKADLDVLKDYIIKINVLISTQNADMNNDGKIDVTDLSKLSLQLNDKIAGDVDCDGYVTQLDLTLLKRYLVKSTDLTAKGLKNADVNNDGKVDVTDCSNLTLMLLNADM